MVDDIKRAITFYEKLGFEVEAALQEPTVS
jgi:predicted lactoylglutathione lyase